MWLEWRWSKADPKQINAARRRAATFILSHWIILGTFLSCLRLEKLNILTSDTPFLVKVMTVAEEWGMLTLLQVPWLLTIRSRWAERFCLWATLNFLILLPLYLLAVTGQRYYQETGVIQNGEMIVYMLSHFSSAKGVLKAGLDASFLQLVLICIGSWLLLAFVGISRLRLRGSDHIAVPATGLVGGVALIFSGGPSMTGARILAGNAIRDLLPVPERAEYLAREVPGWVRYRSPMVDPTFVAAYRQRSEPPPDILLVILESTRTDLFAAYGGDPAIMPYLNEFVQDASVFEDVYVGVSHTTKELVTIHCGMYPLLVMDLVESRPGQVRMNCLPSLLSSLGYTTAFFQSAVNFEQRVQLLVNLGYDKMFVPTRQRVKDEQKRGYLGWEEELALHHVRPWMQEAKRPKLTTLLTLSTHHPYMFPGTVPRNPDRVKESYHEAARSMDASIGKYLLKEKKAGTLDNTIVVVTGDHGEAWGDRPGFLQHDMVPYNEVTKVPLFLLGPGIEKSKRIAGLRHHLDILPTLLRLLGVKARGRLPGHDLVLTGGHPFVVTSCWYQGYCMALRQGDMAYSFFFGRIPLEAYDLSRDPFQTNDVASTIPKERREQIIDLMLGARISSFDAYYGGRPPIRRNPPELL